MQQHASGLCNLHLYKLTGLAAQHTRIGRMQENDKTEKSIKINVIFVEKQGATL